MARERNIEARRRGWGSRVVTTLSSPVAATAVVRGVVFVAVVRQAYADDTVVLILIILIICRATEAVARR